MEFLHNPYGVTIADRFLEWNSKQLHYVLSGRNVHYRDEQYK